MKVFWLFLLVLSIPGVFLFGCAAQPDLIVESAELGPVTAQADGASFIAPLKVVVKNQGQGQITMKKEYEVAATILGPEGKGPLPTTPMAVTLYFTPFGGPGIETPTVTKPIEQVDTITFDTIPKKGETVSETRTAYFTSPWKHGEFEMLVWVDKGDKVKESDNKNNKLKFKVYIP